MSEMEDAVAELRAEQTELDALLDGLSDEEWSLPTPAAGWDVRDQVAHLADTNELAYDTATGGPRQLNEEGLTYTSPEAFTESGCEKGRAMAPAEVLTWWRTTAERVNEMFLGKDPKERLPWGLGMSARMLVTARLMEHWAHSLDIRAALGVEPNASPRLRSIAFLIVKATPYAFGVAKIDPPPGTLRVEVAYDGETWTFGPDDADSRITGDALEFCRVGVQRLPYQDAITLKAEGKLAEAVLRHARAFL
ncbi:MAG TPA: maleylpyruvate isomerase family mycothiol-dependent enzyme [Actinomycetota bacterium]|jgi:uncharacterized protein (TIGR03084 family)